MATANLPTLPFHLVAAFASAPLYTGNQAAIVIFPNASKGSESESDPRAKDVEWMLRVAKDFNFSETAYLVPLSGHQDEGEETEGSWGLRWFTPTQEVTLCGHATLASARTLFSLRPKLQIIKFETRFSGTLTAKRHGDEGAEIVLPSLTTEQLAGLGNGCDISNEQVAGPLGIKADDVLDVSPFEWSGSTTLMVLVKSEVDLKPLRPDIKALGDIAGGWNVTQIDEQASAAGDKLYINTRVFGPGLGVDEDPVTGSSHAYLTGYYLNSPAKRFIPEHLQQNALQTEVEGRQLSDRGGLLNCRWDDGNVKIVGKALEFARGTLFT